MILKRHISSKHKQFKGFHKIIHMGGDEVPSRDFYGNPKNAFVDSPACQRLIRINKKNPDASWQNLKPVHFDDLQAFFTKKYMNILASGGFEPAAWEEPFTFGRKCVSNKTDRDISDCVRPISDYIKDSSVPVYAFNWNIDFESR